MCRRSNDHNVSRFWVGLKKILIEDLPFSNNNGDITQVAITAGNGLSGGTTNSGNHTQTLKTLDITGMGADVVGSQDELILLDNGADMA